MHSSNYSSNWNEACRRGVTVYYYSLYIPFGKLWYTFVSTVDRQVCPS